MLPRLMEIVMTLIARNPLGLTSQTMIGQYLLSYDFLIFTFCTIPKCVCPALSVCWSVAACFSFLNCTQWVDTYKIVWSGFFSKQSGIFSISFSIFFSISVMHMTKIGWPLAIPHAQTVIRKYFWVHIAENEVWGEWDFLVQICANWLSLLPVQ